MKSVGIRELKNRLSEYLREVKRGERILVTDRGHVIAELQSVEFESLEPVVDPGLAQLARRGVVSIGGSNQPELYPKMQRLLPRGRLKKRLTEEQEER